MFRHFIIKLMDMLLSRKVNNMPSPGGPENNSIMSTFITRVHHNKRRGNERLIIFNVLLESRLTRSYPAFNKYLSYWQTYDCYVIVFQ